MLFDSNIVGYNKFICLNEIFGKSLVFFSAIQRIYHQLLLWREIFLAYVPFVAISWVCDRRLWIVRHYNLDCEDDQCCLYDWFYLENWLNRTKLAVLEPPHRCIEVFLQSTVMAIVPIYFSNRNENRLKVIGFAVLVSRSRRTYKACMMAFCGIIHTYSGLTCGFS